MARVLSTLPIPLFYIFFVISGLIQSTYSATAISNKIHTTRDPNKYVIVYSSDVSARFASAAAMQGALTFSLTNNLGVDVTTRTYTVTITALNTENTLYLLDFAYTDSLSLPVGSFLNVNFPDTDPATFDPYIETALRAVPLLQVGQSVDSGDGSRIDKFSDINWIFECVYTGISIVDMMINPSSIIYMYGKMTREMLDVLKIGESIQ